MQDMAEEQAQADVSDLEGHQLEVRIRTIETMIGQRDLDGGSSVGTEEEGYNSDCDPSAVYWSIGVLTPSPRRADSC